MSVSTCGGLIHRGLIFGGAYSWRFTVWTEYYQNNSQYCFIKEKRYNALSLGFGLQICSVFLKNYSYPRSQKTSPGLKNAYKLLVFIFT